LGAIGIAVAPKVISEVREAPLKEEIKEEELPETDTYYEATTVESDLTVEYAWCADKGKYRVNDIIHDLWICDSPLIVKSINSHNNNTDTLHLIRLSDTKAI
jgi:hypothetical protein